MDFSSFTPFPAMTHDFIDSRGDEFHVMVARGTYDLAPSSAGTQGTHVPQLAAEQQPLVFSDRYFGEINRSSVRYESDIVQWKPRCDVIVVGSALSPTGKPVTHIDVGVRIARISRIPGVAEPGVLLEHHLRVHGVRMFERRSFSGWTLTDSRPFLDLPLQYEYAFGGQLKVYPTDDAAKRLDGAPLLSAKERERHPEGQTCPLAHAVCRYNPIGLGYLEDWYARAHQVEYWPAPRIESPRAPITPEIFHRMSIGKVRVGEIPELTPQGMGVIAKPWQPRLASAGTLDERWEKDHWPKMPLDFDMSYWNGAHRDMQCAHLFGGEWVELRNVRASGSSAGRCAFLLPSPPVVAAFAYANDDVAWARAPIDTLVIDLDLMQVSIVWRAVNKASPALKRATLQLADPDEHAT